MGMTWRWTVGVLTVGFLLLPGVASAQDMANSLEELMRSGGLRPGSGVYVTDARGRRLKGDIRGLSTTALEIAHRGATHTFTGAEVIRIERQDSWANGIGYGVLLGAATFYGWCSAAGARECGLYLLHPGFGGIFMLAGGVAGGVVDANRHATIYRASGSARASVKPIVSKGRFGAQLSVGW